MPVGSAISLYDVIFISAHSLFHIKIGDQCDLCHVMSNSHVILAHSPYSLIPLPMSIYTHLPTIYSNSDKMPKHFHHLFRLQCTKPMGLLSGQHCACLVYGWRKWVWVVLKIYFYFFILGIQFFRFRSWWKMPNWYLSFLVYTVLKIIFIISSLGVGHCMHTDFCIQLQWIP